MNEKLNIQHISIRSERIEKLIETHISWIVLSANHAYKIKKPIRYSFVDFSTLQKRKFYCEEELRLNNRITKGMYLEVVPIVKSDGQLVIDGLSDKVEDYAVKMSRQDQEKQMHLMLERNEVQGHHIVQLADCISTFHKNLKPIDQTFSPDELISTFNDVFCISDFVSNYLEDSYNEIISNSISFSNQFIDHQQHNFSDRIERGMIRDCHGDLHSGNIFLTEHPVIFDCIEFNPAFRKIDLLYEIAFFCMDLDVFGRGDFKLIFLENYRQLFPEVMSEESDNLIFIYYQMLRANIRAKVLALKIEAQKIQDQNDPTLREIRNYLNLVKRYLSQLESAD